MTDIEASIAELRAIWGTGPGMHKRPADLARYERIIDEVKPQVVIELGLYYGGSQLWFAERVPWVINVEISNLSIERFRSNYYGLGLPPENGRIIRGNSHEVVDDVARLAHQLNHDGPYLVILDSNHDTETVYGEMIRYDRLVQPGSYMVVEDGLLHYLPCKPDKGFEGPDTPHNWFDGDPLIAIERYLADHKDFVQDREIEDMFPTTQHVGGWLRKRFPNEPYGAGDDAA